MNACFRKLDNTVNHCKMYTISYFNVRIFIGQFIFAAEKN